MKVPLQPSNGRNRRPCAFQLHRPIEACEVAVTTLRVNEQLKRKLEALGVLVD